MDIFRTDLYGWTEGKTSCLDTPDGGESTPAAANEGDGG